MKHKISVKESPKGIYAIFLNGKVKAHGMSKDQAEFFYRALCHGIEECGHKVEMDDSIFETFS